MEKMSFNSEKTYFRRCFGLISSSVKLYLGLLECVGDGGFQVPKSFPKVASLQPLAFSKGRCSTYPGTTNEPSDGCCHRRGKPREPKALLFCCAGVSLMQMFFDFSVWLRLMKDMSIVCLFSGFSMHFHLLLLASTEIASLFPAQKSSLSGP